MITRSLGAALLLPSLLVGLSLALLIEPLAAQDPEIRVRYRSADTVYLDAGRLVGLAEGVRLELLREGRRIGRLQVLYVADHSASCEILEANEEIRSGDLARPLAALTPPAVPESAPEASPPSPGPPTPTPAARPPGASTLSPGSANAIHGVASLGWETFEDSGDAELSSRLTTARLDLRVRRLAGLPLALRVKARARSINRDFAPGTGAGESEDQNRLYELALAWEPDSGRWGAEIGRLRLGPFSGLGWLDGVSGRYRLLAGLEVGAFYGALPDVTELGFESSGRSFGAFGRLGPGDEDGAWDLFLAASREETDAGSERDLVVLESRLGRAGSTFTLFQRAEVLVGERDASGRDSGEGSRLNQLSLVFQARLGEASRFQIAYDRYEPLAPLEAEPDPLTERFEALLRQGLRVGLHLGRPRGLAGSITAGYRDQEGEEDGTYSLGFGLRHPRVLGLGLSLDALGYSNPFSDGLLLILRARRSFGDGHSASLALGGQGSRPAAGGDLVTTWVRVSGWFELPASLFLEAEIEAIAGDEEEGLRARTSLGYRF